MLIQRHKYWKGASGKYPKKKTQFFFRTHPKFLGVCGDIHVTKWVRRSPPNLKPDLQRQGSTAPERITPAPFSKTGNFAFQTELNTAGFFLCSMCSMWWFLKIGVYPQIIHVNGLCQVSTFYFGIAPFDEISMWKSHGLMDFTPQTQGNFRSFQCFPILTPSHLIYPIVQQHLSKKNHEEPPENYHKTLETCKFSMVFP